MIAIYNKYEIAWTHWNYKNDFQVVDEKLEPISALLEIVIQKK